MFDYLLDAIGKLSPIIILVVVQWIQIERRLTKVETKLNMILYSKHKEGTNGN